MIDRIGIFIGLVVVVAGLAFVGFLSPMLLVAAVVLFVLWMIAGEVVG